MKSVLLTKNFHPLKDFPSPHNKSHANSPHIILPPPHAKNPRLPHPKNTHPKNCNINNCDSVCAHAHIVLLQGNPRIVSLYQRKERVSPAIASSKRLSYVISPSAMGQGMSTLSFHQAAASYKCSKQPITTQLIVGEMGLIILHDSASSLSPSSRHRRLSPG